MRQVMWLAAAVAAAILAGPAGPARGQDKVTFSGAVQSLKVGGDLRLRGERFDRSGPGTNDRQRLRFRLRVGADTQLPRNLLMGLRLASGTGEQVSTNQSFDNLSAQKQIWIDTAYLRWGPQLSPNGTVYFQSGRMPNSLWRLYSSDLVWDDDFNPEGLAEGVEWLLARGRVAFFANALQMVADEDKKTPRGQWVFTEQLGMEARLPMNSRLRVAAAYHRWSLENRDDLSQNVSQDGNRRTTTDPKNVLVNHFGVGELTGQVSTWLGGIPLVFQGTIARNFRARDDLSPKADQGYQGGVILGRAKAAKSWEVAGFRKRAETDVTVADVADSDFGDGGTNRQGTIFWVAYNPEEWMQCKVKYFDTQTLDASLSPGEKEVKRVQADFSVKF